MAWVSREFLGLDQKVQESCWRKDELGHWGQGPLTREGQELLKGEKTQAALHFRKLTQPVALMGHRVDIWSLCLHPSEH